MPLPWTLDRARLQQQGSRCHGRFRGAAALSEGTHSQIPLMDLVAPVDLEMGMHRPVGSAGAELTEVHRYSAAPEGCD